MSTTLKENSIPNNLLKDIITTPYMKVLSILKEAKKYINMMSKSQKKASLRLCHKPVSLQSLVRNSFLI